MQDLTKIPLHEILLCNGYEIDRSKSTALRPVLKNEYGDKIIIKKEANGGYLYGNLKDFDNDHGNIISFVKNRQLDIHELIKNYDTNIEIKGKFEITGEPKRITQNELKKEYFSLKNLDKYEIENNILLKARGFNAEYIKAFRSSLKKDKYGNIAIPNYKIQEIQDSNGEIKETLDICGYTRRLNYPITKDKNGKELENPIKNLQNGLKGLEILTTHNKREDLKNINRIIITESIIDSLSLGQMMDYNPHQTLFISTAGQFNEQELQKALCFMLKLMPKANIILAFDNDQRGREYQETLTNYFIKEHQKLTNSFKPFAKDCNDDLRIKNITGLQNLNKENYDAWFLDQIKKSSYKYNADFRSRIRHDFEKLNKIKPISDYIKERINSKNKNLHKAIKPL